MNKLVLAVIVSLNVFALNFEVIGPCNAEPIFSTRMKIFNKAFAGEVTVNTLNAFKIPFQGTEAGLNSVYGSATGLDAMEILSDSKLRSHGWCYAINGFGPSVYPNEVTVTNEDTITWYSCYVAYDSGVWDENYYPSYQVAPAQFCL